MWRSRPCVNAKKRHLVRVSVQEAGRNPDINLASTPNTRKSDSNLAETLLRRVSVISRSFVICKTENRLDVFGKASIIGSYLNRHPHDNVRKNLNRCVLIPSGVESYGTVGAAVITSTPSSVILQRQ